MLKEEYNRVIQMIENVEVEFFKSEEQRAKYIKYAEEIKEKYEALEQKEGEVEIELPLVNLKGNSPWWGILGLIAVAALSESITWGVADKLTNCCCEYDPKDNN